MEGTTTGKRTNRAFGALPLFILSAIFFSLGFSLGKEYLPEEQKSVSVRENPFFEKVEDTLREKFPFREPSEEEKLYASIQGLTRSYQDSYTIFLPPQSAKVFQEDIDGIFGGVGMEVGVRNGLLTIIRPLPNSPAERAGLEEGDIITEVNGESLEDKTMVDVLSMIRGEVGTSVEIGIYRPRIGEERKVEVVRDTVQVPILETEVIGNTFVIHLHNFIEDAIPRFRRALETFSRSEAAHLLIDVRGNPGGFLDAAVDILSYFVPQGEILVREDYGDRKDEFDSDVVRSKGFPFPGGRKPEKIGVLIDGTSASASEIFAGALQDYGMALILGERSYGKGSVQEYIPFENGSSLKVTVARWFTPEGRKISEKGIEPDVYIPNVDVQKIEDIVKLFEETEIPEQDGESE